jgi:probable phosphoglycerate mutase
MLKTEILLVRHGQTTWNVQGKFQGQSDSPLTEVGIQQAQAIAHRLRHETISHIYSSDLLRAYRTAQFIAAARGEQPITTDIRLRERHHGIFQGLSKAEIEVTYPDLYPNYDLDDPHFIIPEGESRTQVSQRGLAMINDLAQRHLGERILVITHGGLLSAILRHVLGLPLVGKRRFTLSNVSLNVISWRHEHWVVETLGDVSHLRPSHHS